MSLQDKRKAVSSSSSAPGPSSSKRVRIDDTTRRTAKRHADTDYFDGDPEIEEQDRRRLRKDQKRGRIDDRGEDLSASDDSDDDADSDAGADAGSHRRRAERRRKASAKDDADDDDDDDMFDVGSDDDAAPSKDKHKAAGKKRFLKLGELEEGQEFGSKKRSALDADADADLVRGDGDAHDDDDDADPDLELEDDAHSANGQDEAVDLNAYAERTPPTSPGGTVQPRAKAPKVTGFNMSDEMRTGAFDADGNYHEHARDPHAQHDTWLTGVYSRTTILDARRAQQARDRALREREATAAQQDGDEDDVKRRLVEHMHRTETVQRTLQRLGKQLSGQKKSGRREDVDKAAGEVESVTHLASVLMSRFGRLDVYERTYESLLHDVHKSGLVRNTFDPAAKFDPPTEPVDPAQTTAEWEYRWTPAYLAAAAREQGTSVDPEIQTFGPFSLADLNAWAKQGYFGDGGDRILVRRAASKDAWIRYAQLES
ncbi:uncharacterized protein PAN0_020d5950 [Moesziomyces antarcticus]|uniref:Uncharacterized protein n=2 Tax=Pseudozyma antarctica TaxID=84753 RepID=A0A081CM25_PSEA2|nr:uncharacterized protein PAN0_020d5950 [Moesziomyces antarcticus]GAK67721.1 conserved hypothetical protein [Moesziomyces antarcticus]SPO49047.1 uncharacterized protein PSANT_06738 [Moesziomyces antarcticus]